MAPGGIGTRVGSAIGAVGGLSFVLVNAGALPVPVDTAARVLGVVGFLAVLAAVVLGTPARPGPDGPPGRGQQVRWLVTTLAMVVAFVAGAAVLRAVGYPDLQVLWVVLVVGVHFWPLAAVLRVPLFRRLGLALVGVALAGGIARFAGWTPAAGSAATVAGLVLLGFALAPWLPPGRTRARG
ncbi:hypothetical protein DT076_08305 [Desertihabitans brevis]|uniref:Uncharacterized protein n=1 Tax=Desertihabitans brevis TaxID=2268447 RepID=A0A367YYG8_9ACTN|nr:hypothetical protein [Desertihabitans brevis]RCK70001.1 hypothetical protein DT076_08305 [Desertihabitans brevis]